MNKKEQQKIKESILNFKLPHYNELPSMGLFLEQTVKYINNCLAPLEEFKITSAMISNYVKMDIISNPAHKTYSKEQIAYLIYITIFKNIISLNDITAMFDIQKEKYSIETAYNYFCNEFDNVLHYIFKNKDRLDVVGEESSNTKELLRNAIMSIAHKIYLNKNLKLFLGK